LTRGGDTITANWYNRERTLLATGSISRNITGVILSDDVKSGEYLITLSDVTGVNKYDWIYIGDGINSIREVQQNNRAVLMYPVERYVPSGTDVYFSKATLSIPNRELQAWERYILQITYEDGYQENIDVWTFPFNPDHNVEVSTFIQLMPALGNRVKDTYNLKYLLDSTWSDYVIPDFMQRFDVEDLVALPYLPSELTDILVREVAIKIIYDLIASGLTDFIPIIDQLKSEINTIYQAVMKSVEVLLETGRYKKTHPSKVVRRWYRG